MSFDPVAYINEPRWLESRLGLDRTAELLDRLGRPQDQLKFVHVAGTNGKGSTCAYLASILQAAGLRTGLFTSPYLITFEERIRVDGANIAYDELVEATLLVKEQAEAMADHPTEFELMTAVALVHFARRGCDIVVLEVGLGGRLDSTNVIDAPEAAVIARIGLDHTKLLGTTLAAIAGEKAGIVKPGSAVVSWPQEPEAMAVVERAAADVGDALAVVDLSRLSAGPVGWSAPGAPARPFSYGRFADLRTRLLGSYQPANAALAIETADALRGRGWPVDDDAVRQGIAEAVWPGRFEIVRAGEGEPTVVVDGGHNPQGARALVDSLNDVFSGRKPVFVIGVLEDKDYPAMLETVLPLGAAFVTVTPDNPRALPADKLARAIRWTGQDLLGCSACVNPYVARDMADALAKARELAGPEGLVCAFGSLYSVGALKEQLEG
ncbi:bifunctional folylpolyglutamate synthase/dihydrofolate synthase [Eggerthella timonensis]|uniref:bifunctional folylpolyglutamate synthase/dihydrofolate synthase n=1 Tax=Eggerthella timonensis TaxID=1871008 RepID=UPI000C78A954|nr:folylpolyglutamate synthase/dihydrofolate synthase family protein [Eggerthella timonensis]